MDCTCDLPTPAIAGSMTTELACDTWVRLDDVDVMESFRSRSWMALFADCKVFSLAGAHSSGCGAWSKDDILRSGTAEFSTASLATVWEVVSVVSGSESMVSEFSQFGLGSGAGAVVGDDARGLS